MATLTELKAQLAAYRKAETAVLVGGQQVEFAGRRLSRGDLAQIRAAIADLERRIALLAISQHGNVVFGGRL